MNRALACVIAIAGWYLMYPPVTHKGETNSRAALSKWEIISTCWNASRARSLDRSHWRRGANEGLWLQSYDRLLDELIRRHSRAAHVRDPGAEPDQTARSSAFANCSGGIGNPGV